MARMAAMTMPTTTTTTGQFEAQDDLHHAVASDGQA
jgi:hypothetical protein